jgi:hypothetical protein
MTNEGYEVAMASCLRPDDAEAILGVLAGDTLPDRRGLRGVVLTEIVMRRD